MNEDLIKLEISEDVKQELKNWFLQQEVTQLESNLSNTIAFFCSALAFLSLLFVVIAYIMNKTFTTKLNKVTYMSEKINIESKLIEQTRVELIKKNESINTMYEELTKNKEALKILTETKDYLLRYTDSLEDGLIQLELKSSCFELEFKINELEPMITEDLIRNFKWENEAETAEECFIFYKENYENGKKEIKSLNIEMFFKDSNKNQFFYDKTYFETMSKYESYLDDFNSLEMYYDVLKRLLNKKNHFLAE